MSELGKCQLCGARSIYVPTYYEEISGRPAWTATSVYCVRCNRERPDLICKDGRIEKWDDDRDN